jgi:predicted nucleic acid-binding protein
MTFDELTNDTHIFIDANIFIYHFGGQSVECRTLLERCTRRELVGYTSTFVVAEVLHRLMISEAVEKGLTTAKNAVQQLAAKPDLVKQLYQYNENATQIASMNLIVVSLTPEILTASEMIRKSEGLLTNDSLVIASMRDLNITDLISADDGFRQVSGIQVYAPSDL